MTIFMYLSFDIDFYVTQDKQIFSLLWAILF